jgi:hypothetical protein
MGSLKKNGVWLLMLVLLGTGCRERLSERFTFLGQETITFEEPAYADRRNSGDAATGAFYVHLDQRSSFGPPVVFQISDSSIHRNIRVYIEADLRKEKDGPGQNIIVSLMGSANDVISWNVLDMDVLVGKNKTWVHICDSTEIPSWANSRADAKIHVFGNNVSPRSYMDLDNLKVTFKAVDYIPGK